MGVSDPSHLTYYARTKRRITRNAVSQQDIHRHAVTKQECYSKVFDNRMITDRRVATIDNGSPEIIESSVEGILAPRRTVALLSYYRINAVTDAGTRLPSLRSAG